ncbi:hypothetical protein Rpal_3071 [Rhodopseudomonas palustris TIE-1]|uniref:hypothetical protein n=1 Tax=Rhodopseudomonas palustris TaxID=1076 RepID=UPI000164A5EE|nr:hypothetical protein [Rhodopseudomonas palustris]ACF01577.1 hypothetical protein Rpal_3071 [Rhodopseudomonas palustris TIE-1]
MANWWDAAPLAADIKSASPPATSPGAGANWWDAAPIANEAAAPNPQMVKGADGAPTRVIMDMSKKPDRGVVDAAARGVAQGLTVNFNDELRGLVEAGGADPNDPASLGKLLTGALQYWTGDAEAKKRYDDAVARERTATKLAEEQHPVASIAGNMAGALALPIGAAGGAVTLPGRMTRGATVGSVLGTAAGAGDGEGASDTIGKAMMGAGVGGVVGGAAPALLRGAELAGAGIAKAAEPVKNSIRGYRDPEAEAARRVMSALERDTANNGAGLDEMMLRYSNANGMPAAIMDMGGEATRALARSAANTSPEARGVLNRTINDRFEGQGPRFTDWLNRTFHYPNAQAQQEAINAVERTVNRQGYAAAYRAGDRDILTPELERLLGSPAVGQAMAKAVESGKNRAVVQGFGGFNPRVTVENGMVKFNRGPTGVPASPNLQLWDYTYRELRDAGQAAYRAGRNEEGASLSALARTMREELDAAVPEFAKARGVAASFFKAENALEAGQKFVAENFNNRQARAALTRMSPNERQLFQDGFVSRFIETLDRVGDRRSVLNQIAQSPAAREKLTIALGPRKAAELETRLRVEGIMDLARAAVQGNSTTARQLIESGLAGGVGYGVTTGDWSPQNLFTAAFVGGVARGAASRANQRIDVNVSRQVADLLTSSDPKRLLAGVQIVARNSKMLDALRAADLRLARVGGQQATVVPLVSAVLPTRSEENKPK